ncbi:hypothetical protein EC973_003778 [Apophysomyces ossiformis]|uniref:Uncharacterized protein n=1 Tax=Apophysomyces ossiformis TaxID=679940 RepID=A0A8H7EQC3_9FUNG|nr:hypothetical protein EC973_003778 [Apophysomyces ossiformis]
MSTDTDGNLYSVIQLLKQQLEEKHNENLDVSVIRLCHFKPLELFGKFTFLSYKDKLKRAVNVKNGKIKIMTICERQNNISNAAQERLELQIYEQDQELTRLQKELQQSLKIKKEVEKKMEQEHYAFENERLQWQQREAELNDEIRSLNASSQAQRIVRRREVGRSPTIVDHILTESPYQGNKLAQPSSKTYGKYIAHLKNDLERQNRTMFEQASQLQIQSQRIEQLQEEIIGINQLNQSLMEENEGYKILLQEKAINGTWATNSVQQYAKEQDGRHTMTSDSDVQLMRTVSDNSLNLATELGLAANDGKARTIQELNEEIRALRDTNRALLLYLERILVRLLNSDGLENVLSVDPPHPNRTSSESAPAATQTLYGLLTRKATDSHVVRRRTFPHYKSKTTDDKGMFPATLDDDMERLKHFNHIKHKTYMPTFSGSSIWDEARRLES